MPSSNPSFTFTVKASACTAPNRGSSLPFYHHPYAALAVFKGAAGFQFQLFELWASQQSLGGLPVNAQLFGRRRRFLVEDEA